MNQCVKRRQLRLWKSLNQRRLSGEMPLTFYEFMQARRVIRIGVGLLVT